MNAQQVLEGTLSPDATTRQAAEQQLRQAAESDFSGFLVTLAQELANEQSSSSSRIAAGIALKNTFSAKEYGRLLDAQRRWTHQISDETRKSIKELALRTLGSSDSRAGQSAGQFITSIAAIELPPNQWPELMPTLVENVGQGSDRLKQASVVTIGFICETEDAALRACLQQHSNAILTAVVQGARKEETNADIRYAAVTALSDSLEFVRSNMDNEGERNYIMQVVCEATQAEDTRIQAGAFGCLNRIMALYYEQMKFYMEKALYGLTIIGMRNEEEDVAKLAVEFWCTVCEEEIAIEDDNLAVQNPSSACLSLTNMSQSQQEGTTNVRPHYNFARVAYQEVVPTLLNLLTRQEEDATDDEYNISRAAYQCLTLFAQCTGSEIVPVVLSFVEANLRDADWRKRDAAVSAFGGIMEGPDERMLDPLVKQALPLLLEKMQDPDVHVRDSAAYAIGRMCELSPGSIDAKSQLPLLIEALFGGLSRNPRMASSCCWALMSIADAFAGTPGSATNDLSPHFQASITALLGATEKPDTNSQLRIAAYEVVNNFVTNSAYDSLPIVANLTQEILKRLEGTIPMQSQVVSIEDKLVLEEIQTSLTSTVLSIIQRLESEIKPMADRIMNVLLQLLQTAGPKSSVPDAALATIGSLATALEKDFAHYMSSFAPFLYSALQNQDEPSICSMAIGLVSDITRSVGEQSQPYCDNFMNLLLTNLSSPTLGHQCKPAILQCFGDIANAIGGYFETYLSVVAQVLQQAAHISTAQETGLDIVDYISSLREGIMDAWSGIILAMKADKAHVLAPYVESIFQILTVVAQDTERSESLARSTMGVIGDLADTFPNGEYSQHLRSDWVMMLIKEVRQNRDYQPRTIEVARWAKEQVRRQPISAMNAN